MKGKILLLLGSVILGGIMGYGQTTQNPCGIPEGRYATAAYATGGNGTYMKDILWLTWGAQSTKDTYGKKNVKLEDDATSYAAIPLGAGKFMCVQAKITEITKVSGEDEKDNKGNFKRAAGLYSYAPGGYSGDFLDDLYNIGGTGGNNRLVNAIAGTDKSEFKFSITASATIDGKPVRLSGMVLADGEVLASNNSEYIFAEAKGDWYVVEMMKDGTEGGYYVEKGKRSTGMEQIRFGPGRGSDTGAVAFMTFAESAYQGDKQAVTFEVRIVNGGITAVALGLLPPSLDTGDAPESYGAAWHLIEDRVPTEDGIIARSLTESEHLDLKKDEEDKVILKGINTNASIYNVGGFSQGQLSYIGSKAPDSDDGGRFSDDAEGDNTTGTGTLLEEDAWNNTKMSFRYDTNYKGGKEIILDVPYFLVSSKKGYLAGWIDFNRDGIFSEEEKAKVVSTDSRKKNIRLKWVIPTNRKAGKTFVRLRYGENEGEVNSPVGFAIGGEVEDHMFYVSRPAMINPVLRQVGN